MKILFLSRWFPYPSNNGSKLRIYSLLCGLSERYSVTLLSFFDPLDKVSDGLEIQSKCEEIHVVPWREFDPHSRSSRLAFFHMKPRSVVDTFSREMAEEIKELLIQQKFDLIIASQLPMAVYYPYFGDTPALFEEAELGLSYFNLRDSCMGWQRRLRHALTWFKFRRYFSNLLDAFEMCTVVSEKEKQLITKNFPYVKKVSVIPNCLNMEDYMDIPVDSMPDTLIFTGAFRYYANYEAMQWFLKNVFPLVLKRIPTARLIITGDHANLPLPFSENITLMGHVDEIKTLIASCSISIAPLLSGGGTRLKIIEAMALGTPVIATSKGAEGLDVVNRKHLLVADTPISFAECVVELLQNKDLHHQLTQNARLLVQEKYNWKIVLQNYFSLINSIVQ